MTMTTPLNADAVDRVSAEGEDLHIAERVVVAPSVGVFRPCALDARAAAGEIVTAGQVIGFVEALGDHAEVRSPFSGVMMGMLALAGERVHARQPVAWLRTV